MNVKELKELLADCDDDDIVVLSLDSVGNRYCELSSVDTCSNWDEEDETVGFRELTEDLEADGYSDEDVIEGEPCIVLYP